MAKKPVKASPKIEAAVMPVAPVAPAVLGVPIPAAAQPVAPAPVATDGPGRKSLRPRLADYEFAVFVGNKLVAPVNTVAEVQQIVAELSVKNQGRVVVMRQVPVVVETKVTFKG